MIAYTAITNGKDKERRDIRVFSGFDKFKNDCYNAKIYKVLAHQFLDCDISIWMDGNITLLIPPEQAVEMWLKEADMAVFKHKKSRNLEQELKWIRYKFGRNAWQVKEAEEQVKLYEGIVIDEMMNGGFIIRRHTPLVERFNEAWWAEICVHGQRDQLSIPVVIKRFPELKVNRIDLDIKNNPYLRYEEHLHFST